MNIKVETTGPQRIDQFLAGRLTELSRAKIQALLKSGDIQLNGTKVKAKQTVATGDTITVALPDADNASRPVTAQDIPLHVLYEDEDMIVIDKAPGMVVHPAAGNEDGTLVNALLFHCAGRLSGTGDETGDEENGIDARRPGIVHRLDKDTSGCMVAAKTDSAHRSLAKQFAARSTEKRYLAVLQSKPNKNADTVFTHIGRHPVNRMKMTVVNPGSGKAAITDYRVLHTADNGTSLVLCDLHTGRTHQIRVHMVHLGAPILGDPIYAKPARQALQPGRLMLHAWQLVLDHPETGERMAFQSGIPDAFTPWTDAAGLA